jgi:hypothetical protein
MNIVETIWSPEKWSLGFGSITQVTNAVTAFTTGVIRPARRHVAMSAQLPAGFSKRVFMVALAGQKLMLVLVKLFT